MIMFKYGIKQFYYVMTSANRYFSQSIVLSGIQPTGSIHLGNYFGAIKQWLKLQEDLSKKCIFSIADLHTFTMPTDSQQLNYNIKLIVSTLLACGIDPEKCIIFQQSSLPQNASLCWLLASKISLKKLSGLPQYQEKSSRLKTAPVNLLLYPILQASDILLLQADEVPIGSDQIAHLNLVSHLVHKFNNKYGNVLKDPKQVIPSGYASRIKSLRMPQNKMSKSEADPKGKINLTDSCDEIRKKCKKAITDFTSAVTFDPIERPGVSNLILLHSLSTGKSFKDICDENRNLSTSEYKLVVADALIELINPIRNKIHLFLNKEEYLRDVLEKGRYKANIIAEETLDKVYKAVGLKI